MEYNFQEIEKRWQQYWQKHKTFAASNNSSKEKYYVLDMFPYPSGSGLHVGHPLGYIASDIFSRFKRHKGFNVLHPMGYDAFGLPAEQYAIQTGQHPAITTEQNIKRYREQLDNLGFSFDWDRQVKTSDPDFYKWTQWIFTRLFNSWYNPDTQKAEPIDLKINALEKNNEEVELNGKSQRWNSLNDQQKQEALMAFRLAYLSDTMVNWCPGLGTVLANEEVKDGISERGGFPVERKMMKQWSLRITAYAERLLKDLDPLDWTDSIKDAQRNWIGKSEGAAFSFEIKDNANTRIEVFSTRPDTIFGCTFLVLAPEHALIAQITTREQEASVKQYVDKAKNKSDRDRMADVKQVSGVFTGAYVIHPFTKKEVPVWISDYVLAGYGTGAIMAVPAHDSRDFSFAKQFHLPIIRVNKQGDDENLELKSAIEEKTGILIQSEFLNGKSIAEASQEVIHKLEQMGIGTRTINYRLRDAIFSRQRYWGEPFPVYYKNGIPFVLEEKELPVSLPPIDVYLPTEKGEPPLARAKEWTTKNGFTPDYNTMPGWAGSSWYFLRYMDPENKSAFASKDAVNYWKQVDLYVGGAEHATGHLLYFRFWTKFLYDYELVPEKEPAKKLVNQGMILGRSLFLWQGFFENINDSNDTLIRICSVGKIPDQLEHDGKTYKNIGKFHYRIMIHYADEKDRLTPQRFEELKKNEMVFGDVDIHKNVIWELDGAGEKFIQLNYEIEKMSKSKFNVVNPDDIVSQFGADTLRMYEMFLGPLDQHKPWNTNGISGVHNFLKKFWRLYYPNAGNADATINLEEAPATKAELKALHKIIKKTEEDIEKFSFNTAVSAFMICVNELTELKCRKKVILEPLCVLLSSFAPHICEEIWRNLNHAESIEYAPILAWEQQYLVEDTFEYPVSVNGKTRCKIEIPLHFNKEQIEKEILSSNEVIRVLNNQSPKKIIVVHGRIVNIVV